MAKKITVVLFLLMIYGMTIFSFIKKEDRYSETENRPLKRLPTFSADTFFRGEFSEDYEEYIKDQFPWRDGFVELKTYCEIGLGKTSIKDIFLGKDSYLIENHKKENYESEKAIKNKDAIISFINRWVQKLGEDRVSVLLAPTAQSILTDKLPVFAEPYDQNDYLNLFKNDISDKVLIDIYSKLKENKDEYIYYRTDHHWTTYGAFLAYEKWCEVKGYEPHDITDYNIEKASDEFLGTIHSKLNISAKADTIEFYSLKDYDLSVIYNMSDNVTDTLFDKSYLKSKDKYSSFFGGNPGIVEIKSKGYKEKGDDRVLLLIKDSYANCFAPLLVDMYDEIYIVDLRYFNMKIDKFIEEYDVTDVMLLYNVDTLTSDAYIGKIK